MACSRHLLSRVTTPSRKAETGNNALLPFKYAYFLFFVGSLASSPSHPLLSVSEQKNYKRITLYSLSVIDYGRITFH